MDSDGNGLLSYDEVYELSKASLEKSIKTRYSSEIIEELADYFATKIFKMVRIPVDEEIPLSKIKDVKK